MTLFTVWLIQKLHPENIWRMAWIDIISKIVLRSTAPLAENVVLSIAEIQPI